MLRDDIGSGAQQSRSAALMPLNFCRFIIFNSSAKSPDKSDGVARRNRIAKSVSAANQKRLGRALVTCARPAIFITRRDCASPLAHRCDSNNFEIIEIKLDAVPLPPIPLGVAARYRFHLISAAQQSVHDDTESGTIQFCTTLADLSRQPP